MAYFSCFAPVYWAGKSGRLHMFCYQFGGSSHSGLATVSEGMGCRCLTRQRGKTASLGYQEPISCDAERGVMMEPAPVTASKAPQP